MDNNGFRRRRPQVIIFLRLLLGGVLLYAAYTKLREPWQVFAMSIAAYGLLPEWAVWVTARTLPWLELLLAAVIISGYGLRFSSLAITGLLGTFFAVMLYSFARVMGIDCGCFGPGDALGSRTLLRDGALLAASILLTFLAFSSHAAGARKIQEPNW
jgi:putative oxidoreductase